MLSNETSWVRPAMGDFDFVIRARGHEEVSTATLFMRARGLLRCRKARAHQFSSAMFAETAWDMLLTLYVSEADVEAMTASRLAQLVDAPPSSALRWLDYLEAQRLVCRQAHPTDRRSALVKLTDKGRANLELFLTETLEIMP
jgi:DNA-binding MarR family transcriptional regulator